MGLALMVDSLRGWSPKSPESGPVDVALKSPKSPSFALGMGFSHENPRGDLDIFSRETAREAREATFKFGEFHASKEKAFACGCLEV